MDFGLTFIGAGRLGGALAIALEGRGYQVINLVSRRRASAENIAGQLQSATNIFQTNDLAGFAPTQIIFITTPDQEIEIAAQNLAGLTHLDFTQTIFLHTSGSLASDALTALRERGGKIGSLHPLVSVSDAALGADNFAGAYFCLEGDVEAVKVGEQIVAALAGHNFTIPTAQKPLYHAAAVMCAGHLVALFDAASQTLAECGVERETARNILLPLVSSTVANLKKQPPSEALTGPIARADAETMRKHFRALFGSAAFDIYLALAERSVEIVAEKGVDQEKLSQMRNEINYWSDL